MTLSNAQTYHNLLEAIDTRLARWRKLYDEAAIECNETQMFLDEFRDTMLSDEELKDDYREMVSLYDDLLKKRDFFRNHLEKMHRCLRKLYDKIQKEMG